MSKQRHKQSLVNDNDENMTYLSFYTDPRHEQDGTRIKSNLGLVLIRLGMKGWHFLD